MNIYKDSKRFSNFLKYFQRYTKICWGLQRFDNIYKLSERFSKAHKSSKICKKVHKDFLRSTKVDWYWFTKVHKGSKMFENLCIAVHWAAKVKKSFIKVHKVNL